MTVKYISAWEIHTSTLRKEVEKAAKSNQVNANDTVWCGPSGDAVIAASPADIENEYGDYVDSGTVEEYLD